MTEAPAEGTSVAAPKRRNLKRLGPLASLANTSAVGPDPYTTRNLYATVEVGPKEVKLT